MVVVPIVSVTPLGSTASGVDAAIDQIISYLQRGAARRPEPHAAMLGYYADSPTQRTAIGAQQVASQLLDAAPIDAPCGTTTSGPTTRTC